MGGWIIGVSVALIVALATTLGLLAALRSQRKYNQRLERERAAIPSPAVDPEQALFEQQLGLADAVDFDPTGAIEVTEQQLLDRPTECHAKVIRVSATWGHYFESSTIAGAWARRLDQADVPYGQYHVRATGVWVFPRPVGSTRGMPGFGHLGMSGGEFRIHLLEILPERGPAITR